VIVTSAAADHNATVISPTSRVRKTPNFGSRLPVGVDTVRFRGRARSHKLRGNTLRTQRDRDTDATTTVRSLSYDSVMVMGHPVRLQTDDQRGLVTCEVSVPKVLRTTNEVPASCEEVPCVVQLIHRAAWSDSAVEWLDDWADLRATRVDYVQPFRVSRIFAPP
jgi:hypothetical protein